MLLLRCFREVDPMTCCARQTLEVYTRAWPPSWTRHPQLSSARKHPVCLRRRYYKTLSLSLSLSCFQSCIGLYCYGVTDYGVKNNHRLCSAWSYISRLALSSNSISLCVTNRVSQTTYSWILNHVVRHDLDLKSIFLLFFFWFKSHIQKLAAAFNLHHDQSGWNSFRDLAMISTCRRI